MSTCFFTIQHLDFRVEVLSQCDRDADRQFLREAAVEPEQHPQLTALFSLRDHLTRIEQHMERSAARRDDPTEPEA